VSEPPVLHKDHVTADIFMLGLWGIEDKRKRKRTTPDEEGIEFYPDAWERFERTVDRVVKAPPAHQTAKTTDGDRSKRKRRAPADDK
jgi:hypothetical protein